MASQTRSRTRAGKARGGPGRLPGPTRRGYVRSHVEVLHLERVVLDELAADFDVLAHQDAEEPLGLAGLVERDLQQHAAGRVERRVPQLLAVHLAQPLEPLDLDALLAQRVDLV